VVGTCPPDPGERIAPSSRRISLGRARHVLDWDAHRRSADGSRYRSLERVRLCEDVPEQGLARGESGTVVHVFETADAYLVEFVNPADGSTCALVEFTPDQLGPPADDRRHSTSRMAPPALYGTAPKGS
jgi:hypothetical protein